MHGDSVTDIRVRRDRCVSVIVAAVSVFVFSERCIAEDEAANQVTNDSARDEARHRIDLGALFLDEISSDAFNAIVGYTYSFSSNANISVTVPYVDPNRATSGDSGFGDTIVAVSFVPSVKLGANPWVPRTVGSGVAVLAPTGRAEEGRSLDSWVVAPYLGLVLPLADRIFFAPQLGYVHSLDSTAADTDLRIAFAELGLGYVSLKGFWTSYFPSFSFDLESDSWAVNHRLAIGKMFSRNLGLSADYTFIERFNFGSDLPGESGFDQQIEISFHFAF
jgi:hypothetical protein